MIVVEIKGETEETSGLSGETVRSSGITEACLYSSAQRGFYTTHPGLGHGKFQKGRGLDIESRGSLPFCTQSSHTSSGPVTLKAQRELTEDEVCSFSSKDTRWIIL